MTLGLAKLNVYTIEDTRAMKKATGLLDAIGYRPTLVTHALKG